MLLRLRLLVASLGGGVLLLLILCLGAQNLDQRASLNLGFGRTAELPTGFLVGVALVIGVISGGSATALLLPRGDFEQNLEILSCAERLDVPADETVEFPESKRIHFWCCCICNMTIVTRFATLLNIILGSNWAASRSGSGISQSNVNGL